MRSVAISGSDEKRTAVVRKTLVDQLLRTDRVALMIVAAIAVFFAHTLGAFTRFPGTLIDSRFNQLVLEHLYNYATGREGSLVDLPMFYPASGVLFLSDTHFGSGAVYVALRALSATREAAFDGWFLGGMLTTLAAGVHAFRKLGLSTGAALVGGTAFAFCLPMLANLAHSQLVYRFPIPLATLAALRFARARDARSLIGLALWVSWQFLCSVYLGVFLVEWVLLIFLTAPFVRIEAPAPEASPLRDGLRAAGAAFAVAAAGWMLWRHADLARVYDVRRSLEEIASLTPDWRGLLSMAGSPTVGWASRLGFIDLHLFNWDQQLFPGLGLLILAVVGAWAGFREGRLKGTVALCVFAIVALHLFNMKFGEYGAYRLWTNWPGLNAIRYPGRVALVAAFPLAWLAAIGFSVLSASTAERRLLALAGLALALVDIVGFKGFTADVAEAQARVEAVKASLDAPALRARRAVLARYETDGGAGEYARELDLAFAVQDLGLVTANGYSGSPPPTWRRWRSCDDVRMWASGLSRLPRARADASDVASRLVFEPGFACDPPPRR